MIQQPPAMQAKCDPDGAQVTGDHLRSQPQRGKAGGAVGKNPIHRSARTVVRRWAHIGCSSERPTAGAADRCTVLTSAASASTPFTHRHWGIRVYCRASTDAKVAGLQAAIQYAGLLKISHIRSHAPRWSAAP
jgi:hypothetical protein